MSSLGFGLNIPKSRKTPAGPPSRKPIARKPPPGFGGADDADGRDEGSDDEPAGGVFGSKANKSSTASKPGSLADDKRKKDTSRTVVNAQLATFNALSQKASADAASSVDDPSIYDYDGVWETMKSVDRKKKAIEEAEAAERKPKYMESLLQAAEVRKRDQLRAKEKMLQKEREAEGDEFKDKEKFVTEAYKAQQEEMRKLEEEERIREEKERAKSQGLTGFYRNMLNRTEQKHDELIAAAATTTTADKQNGPASLSDEPQEKSTEQIAAEINARRSGAIEINDEGLVVDKRQLLSAGLNVTAPPKKASSTSRADAAGRAAESRYAGRSKQVVESRMRQSRMIEQQLEQAQKRALEEETKAMADVERQTKTRKTEADVMGARERYLARKKAQQEEAARKKG